MLPITVFAQQQRPEGFAEWIDKIARTPLSQIILLVVVCTVLRVVIAPKMLDIPPKHRVPGSYKTLRFFNEFLDAIIYAGVFVFLVIRPFGVQAFRIPTESMVSTLLVNDFIVANKLIYRISDPKPGDIVVFRPPAYACNPDQLGADGQPNVDFIKRCVGVEGDIVEIRNGKLWRNGKEVDEPYRKQPSTLDFKLVKYHDAQGREEYWPITYDSGGINVHAIKRYSITSAAMEQELRDLPPAPIPKGYFLPFGDNSPNSSDGRMWGLVKREDLIGRSEAIWLPLKRMGRTR